MPTLETNDLNILDAETINWRLIVYPLLAALIIVVGGFGYYYYLQNQREQLETSAREALVQAKTPGELVKVADQFPGADQATLALLQAGADLFAKQDYDGAIQAYQRIIQTAATNPDLSDSAQLGLASSQEAKGKMDEAITSYLAVAQHGAKSPYAAYAYSTVARLYDERGDKENERKTLIEAAGLDSDSPFVKQAQYKLKQMSAAPPTPPSVSPAAAPMNATPASTPVTPAATPPPAAVQK